VDESRTDLFIDGSTDPRELMVKVYYPAVDDASKPYASYFHDQRELPGLLATGYNLPGFLFSHFPLVKTHSKDDLAVSDASARYPVILFSHGGGTSMETHTAQGEDLASHGYIVVLIDHSYVSSATVFPDHVVTARDATTNFNLQGEPVAIINQIMADDARFVIDALEAMDAGSLDSPFAGRLDLDHIGAMGHSLGGGMAYNLAFKEPRVKAAINLDGAVYVLPGDLDTMAPYLMLMSDGLFLESLQGRRALMMPFDEMPALDQEITLSIYGSREAYQKSYAEATASMNGLADTLQASGNLYVIEGSAHMKFADIGLYFGIPQLREAIDIGGGTSPRRVLEITQALTVAFFDQHLKGEAESLDALLAAYPELRQVHLESAASD
jgi:dienelactone hydrolase